MNNITSNFNFHKSQKSLLKKSEINTLLKLIDKGKVQNKENNNITSYLRILNIKKKSLVKLIVLFIIIIYFCYLKLI